MNIKLNLKLLLLTCILNFFIIRLFPQKLITDRPDIESAILPGFFQIENGFVFEEQKLNADGNHENIHGYNLADTIFSPERLRKSF
jgi:hypothetical protein